MRQILVDHARARSRLKRGGPYTITGLRDEIGVAADMVDLVALDAGTDAAGGNRSSRRAAG